MLIWKNTATLLVAGAAVVMSATPALAAQPSAGSAPARSALAGSVLPGPAPAGAALLGPASAGAAQAITDTGTGTARTITVTGTGTASGTPDELQLSLDISATAASVSSALDAANRAAAQVRDTLIKNGVAAADLQTSGMSVQPQYDQKDAITGYSADESLTAELHGLGKAGQVISDAVNAGGNAVRVDNVQLDLNNQSGKLLARARAEAIDDARQRAEEYAKAAGCTLGPVLSIAETGASVPVRPLLAFGPAMSAVSAVPISAGTQRVTASVTVMYGLS
jgi:uncharacterized protein YggE